MEREMAVAYLKANRPKVLSLAAMKPHEVECTIRRLIAMKAPKAFWIARTLPLPPPPAWTGGLIV